MVVADRRADQLGRDRAELHRPARHGLGHLPEVRVVQGSARDLPHAAWHHPALHDLEDDVALARPPVSSWRPIVIGARQPLEPPGGILEPAHPPDIGIEPGVAVGDDVQPGSLLVTEIRADGVRVLLAEARVAQGIAERSAPQGLRVPRGPGERARDGGRQLQVLGDLEHASLLPRDAMSTAALAAAASVYLPAMRRCQRQMHGGSGGGHHAADPPGRRALSGNIPWRSPSPHTAKSRGVMRLGMATARSDASDPQALLEQPGGPAGSGAFDQAVLRHRPVYRFFRMLDLERRGPCPADVRRAFVHFDPSRAPRRRGLARPLLVVSYIDQRLPGAGLRRPGPGPGSPTTPRPPGPSPGSQAGLSEVSRSTATASRAAACPLTRPADAAPVAGAGSPDHREHQSRAVSGARPGTWVPGSWMPAARVAWREVACMFPMRRVGSIGLFGISQRSESILNHGRHVPTSRSSAKNRSAIALSGKSVEYEKPSD